MKSKYEFDSGGAEKLFKFFSQLKHVEGPFAGEKIKLADFQKYGLWLLMGWKQKNGLRRFRKVYEEEARKQGKSIRVSGLGIYMLIADGEQGAQVYAAATKEDQAKIVFEYASQLIRTNSTLSKRLKIYHKSIVDRSTFSRFKVLGGDSKTQDGFNPSMAIIDEYHAHPDSSVLNVIESGMGARLQPLIYIITTAGFNKESACYNLRNTSIEVLRGIKDDPRLLPIIHSLDDGDDWNDVSTWHKSNPNLRVTEKINGMAWADISLNFLKDRHKSAVNEGGIQEIDFKTKNLNIWCNVAKSWMPDEVWVKNTRELKKESLLGKKCYGGLDLAKGIDLNAFVLYFPDDKAILPFFWIPNEKMHKNRDGVDYIRWANQEYIFEMEGGIMDYDRIGADIMGIIKEYDFKSLAYDTFLSHHGLIQKLTNEGITCMELRQGYLSLSTPTKELEKLITGAELEHFDNPVMRWMVGNVMLETDAAGNIKPHKGKSKNKIDGVAALVNAIALCMSEDSKQEHTPIMEIWK